jgi:hypothetical protein
MYDPRPYVPLDVSGRTQSGKRKIRFGEPQDVPNKPWLALRPGETAKEWQIRTSRCCYRCGAYIVDKAALDAHELDDLAHRDDD